MQSATITLMELSIEKQPSSVFYKSQNTTRPSMVWVHTVVVKKKQKVNVRVTYNKRAMMTTVNKMIKVRKVEVEINDILAQFTINYLNDFTHAFTTTTAAAFILIENVFQDCSKRERK